MKYIFYYYTFSDVYVSYVGTGLPLLDAVSTMLREINSTDVETTTSGEHLSPYVLFSNVGLCVGRIPISCSGCVLDVRRW